MFDLLVVFGLRQPSSSQFFSILGHKQGIDTVFQLLLFYLQQVSTLGLGLLLGTHRGVFEFEDNIILLQLRVIFMLKTFETILLQVF